MHTEEGSKGLEEVGGEFRAAVRQDVEGDSVLHKYLGNKRICNIDGSSVICCRDEDTFLGKVVNYYQNHHVTVRRWELFDEVHADRMPWSVWYRKWL